MSRLDKETASAKAALRRRMLAERSALSPEERGAAAERVRERLRALEAVTTARTILGYAAFGSEVDLDPLLADLADRGCGVFLPRVVGERLEITRVRDLGRDLVPGWRGVREPRTTGRPPARLDRIEAVLVPGVAFDGQGHRLGYGGGHFDRLLGELSAGTFVVGVAFDVQVVDAVPVEAHDRRVGTVVTEARTIRLEPPGKLPPEQPNA